MVLMHEAPTLWLYVSRRVHFYNIYCFSLSALYRKSYANESDPTHTLIPLQLGVEDPGPITGVILILKDP